MATTPIGPFRKPAVTDHPVHDLIRERWSPRAFSDLPVEHAKLQSLFEAARWAPSAGNQQPWYFLLATRENSEAHTRFANILFERNTLWAQHAPVLILTVVKLYERAGLEQTSYFDVGMAVGNLLMQAVDFGLMTHQMSGLDREKAVAELNIPEGFVPHTMIAIGYPGAPDKLPDDLRERETFPRERKTLQEFVFAETWQQPVPDIHD
ncbi:MAG TPA: nitroreductase family protein [Dictyobacter sp.]|jgi:nitroreductase|nr:nitroreductase family protein [Dictyobacter sp.]